MRTSLSDISHAPATVAVVGLGKIGLPLAVHYAQQGWRVIGCDTDPHAVARANVGQAELQEEPGLTTSLTIAVAKGMFWATTDIREAVSLAQVVVVSIPMMTNLKHETNFEELDNATTAIGAGLRPDTLIIYETAVPVGTTARRCVPILERTSRLRAGEDFLLAYSPQRVSIGSIFRDLRLYPKVVAGIDPRSTEAARRFYHSVLEAEILTMNSLDEAEFVKLIETTYRDVNIALANEYACYADVHGLNVANAIAVANTHPYVHIHTPGVGVGGRSVPVHPYLLLSGPTSTMSRPHNTPLSLPRTARRINDKMAQYAVHRVNTVVGPLTGQSVLILGVAYQANVHEDTFSSARLLQQAFLEHGAHVYVDDPLFTTGELLAAGYKPLSAEVEGRITAIVLQAGHRIYQGLDWRRFSHCQVVLDGRGVLERKEIEALGMRYIAIGDGTYEASKSWKSASVALTSS